MRNYSYSIGSRSILILVLMVWVLNCGLSFAQPKMGSATPSAMGSASSSPSLQSSRSKASVVRGGRLVELEDEARREIDSLAVDEADSLRFAMDSLGLNQTDSLAANRADSLPPKAKVADNRPMLIAQGVNDKEEKEEKVKIPYFNDSMSYRRVVGTSIFLPGFGQIYNKQAWKLPIIYGALGASTAMLIHENKTYRPLKQEYDDYTYYTTDRSDYLDNLQSDYIRSSRRRNTYIGMIAASTIYALGDAAINYTTKDVSSVRKATTLSAICPGAGQIYNKSYWKLPFIVGGITTMVFVYDWNNRGYIRFTKAYEQTYAYEQGEYDEPIDEFGGAYSSTYMKSLRDSYRRNRDLSIIIAVGLYIFQIIDANVDSHLKDFDISNDLASVKVNPLIDYAYLPSSGSNSAIFGLNFGISF
ncbi:MAG: DUF5683 domain-containing protein [Rikenellaceae bacterium]